MKTYEDILEYYKIKNELIDYAILNSTKEKFLDLTLYTSKEKLEEELSLMLDMIDFYKYDDGFSIEVIKDIDAPLKSLEILGSYLETVDLSNIRMDIILYRKCKSRAKNVRDKYKRIYDLFVSSIDTKDLETVLNDIIDDDGNILETASPLLKDVRKQKHIINETIKDKLDGYINDPKFSNAIAEKFITTRNDRYVLAVKTDFKGLIKGIEHDKSSTGNTTYLEPLGIVSLNNRLREYEAREREEIRKILIRITEYIRGKKEEVLSINETLKRLDFLNAKVIFSHNHDCTVPKILTKGTFKLVNARHPFIPKDKVVPISFSIDEKSSLMLITGPNTGGKTVTLKVAGLLSIMALSGIPIPSDESSQILMFDRILADIGDEQSIEQNLSSFSSHVSSIANILKDSTSKSLILLDELGSGTDPIEGAAFAMSIIDYLNNMGCYGIISTHYSEVKAHAYNNQGIKTSSMEFDVKTLAPTYRLIEGIPGESNALIIAKKYGISDDIIQNAKSYISEDNKKVEKMLQAIKKQNEDLELANEKVRALTEELNEKKEEYNKKIFDLEYQKEEILNESIKKADEYIRNMQAKAKALIEKINQEDASKQNVKDTQRSINMLYNSIIEDKKKSSKPSKIKIKDTGFSVGEEILVKSLNKTAKIIKILDTKASLQVQAGILKMVIPIADAIKLKHKNTKPKGTVIYKRSDSKTEIDVRGMIASEAIHDIESFLDKAVLTGYTLVYIVHGKGTMVLRQKIREYLKTSPYVKEFKDAEQNEGGHGCTVVTLK
ncbi:endonuclease MutS2 [Sneathia sp. DSM 16631]|uniref:endonuclease MutS2 n=1 Tax=Sneathia TaxID=168808 RepID=UPI00186905CC|nr:MULTISPECIES: endonuclease MutS2 [Sneathia]MBE3030483.1 endonuclease MutS2 [Sneathia sp. DSM 16631]MDK9582191.1 endonuclease MutS2 [Sneathia vaginalis]